MSDPRKQGKTEGTEEATMRRGEVPRPEGASSRTPSTPEGKENATSMDDLPGKVDQNPSERGRPRDTGRGGS